MNLKLVHLINPHSTITLIEPDGKVHKYENNYYFGYIDNIPISKTIKYNQYIKVHKNKVVESQ